MEREYNLDLVTTAPGVVYRVHKTNGEIIELTNPSNLPEQTEIDYMEEYKESGYSFWAFNLITPEKKYSTEEMQPILMAHSIRVVHIAALKYTVP